MKERLEELERWGADVIFGRAKGIRASLARFLMRGLSTIFRAIVALRLAMYRNNWKTEHHLGTQVISVGNLTVGGTGKTPVVELLARTLRDHGRNVAILSRGYKSHKLEIPQSWRDSSGRRVSAASMPKIVSNGSAVLLDSKYAGDEPYMLGRNLAGVSVIVDRDRVKGGRFAISHLNADTLLLDDGMQYLDLAHSMDIVLVDSTAPFGTGAMLPRGTLREPPPHLRRASYIVLTKCDGSSNVALIEKIRRHNPVAGIIETTHGPIHLENVFTGVREPLSLLQDKWVGAISAIAVPEAFESSLTRLGAKVEIQRRFSDHHRFSRRDVERFIQRCVERDMELIATTEKDAVRFPRPKNIDVPVYFLRIEVKILQGQATWDEMISRIVKPQAVFDSLIRNQENYAA